MFRKALIIFITFITLSSPCFALNKELNTSWSYYKSIFINKDGRVIDHERDKLTTSEGQAYAMLRAILIKDQKTFDKVYSWTKNNLKRSDDNLFAWAWGFKQDKTCGVIDTNSATDADVDIAFSLISASKLWKNPSYLDDAKKIIADIWQKETITINNEQILTAGADQTTKTSIDINPSYFAPYAFKEFAKYDKNDWNSLVDSNYKLINKVTDMNASKLPPDWFLIDKQTGEITVDKDSCKSDFSYDAVRTFFRIYLDYALNNDIRAKTYIQNANIFLNNWQKDNKFYTNIKSDGTFRDSNEAIGSIAVLLPAINTIDPKTTNQIYKNKIKTTYNEIGYWNNPFDYYAQNLTWIGIWLYLNK